MEVITDFPERIRQGKTLYVGESHQPMRVTSRRVHGGNLLLAFDGIDTPEEVGRIPQPMGLRTCQRPAIPIGRGILSPPIDRD